MLNSKFYVILIYLFFLITVVFFFGDFNNKIDDSEAKFEFAEHMYKILTDFQLSIVDWIFKTYIDKNTYLKHSKIIYNTFTTNLYIPKKINYSKIEINYKFNWPSNETIAKYWRSDFRYKIWGFYF